MTSDTFDKKKNSHKKNMRWAKSVIYIRRCDTGSISVIGRGAANLVIWGTGVVFELYNRKQGKHWKKGRIEY